MDREPIGEMSAAERALVCALEEVFVRHGVQMLVCGDDCESVDFVSAEATLSIDRMTDSYAAGESGSGSTSWFWPRVPMPALRELVGEATIRRCRLDITYDAICLYPTAGFRNLRAQVRVGHDAAARALLARWRAGESPR
jgi:hypothetical protein